MDDVEQNQDVEQQEAEPYKRLEFKTKDEHDEHYNTVYKDREKRLKEKAEAEFLQKVGAEDLTPEELAEALSEYRVIEEATQTEQSQLEKKAQAAEKASATLKETLVSTETQRDAANDRVEELETLVRGFVEPQRAQLEEHYRELLADRPIEWQADWLTKNAEKIGNSAGQGAARPAGSRPTGKPETPPRKEQDKEARENQRRARVSAI